MCNAFVCVGHMAAYEFYGHMAELVDAPVSGTGGATHGSSSLLMPTTLRQGFGWQATLRQGFGWQAFVFASGKAVIIKKFWGCSSVDRALRSHRRGRGFESHQLHHPSPRLCGGPLFVSGGSSKDWQKKYKKSWGYGGMVDAEDLKSFDHCDRVGSSPTIPTTLRGTLRVAGHPSWNDASGRPQFAEQCEWHSRILMFAVIK